MRNDVRNTHTTDTHADVTQLRRTARLFARTGRRGSLVVTGLVAGAVLGGGGYALAASSAKTVHGCVSNKTHTLTVQKRCAKGTKALSWNQVGPRGATGKTGATGATGATGPQGPAGGANVVVDSADISGSGFVVATSGITNVQHPSAGTFQFTAAGCSKLSSTPQVLVSGGATSPVVVANVNGGTPSGTGSFTWQVHLTETASSNGATLTTLTNPIPVDAGFYLTVTC